MRSIGKSSRDVISRDAVSRDTNSVVFLWGSYVYACERRFFPASKMFEAFIDGVRLNNNKNSDKNKQHRLRSQRIRRFVVGDGTF